MAKPRLSLRRCCKNMNPELDTKLEPESEHTPERMCVACRTRSEPQNRLRLVSGPGNELGCDLREKLGGRGAWVCANRACFDKLFKRKYLGSGFKGVFWPDKCAFIAFIVDFLNQSIRSNLGLAYRGGLIVAGRDEVKRHALAAKIKVILLAADLAVDSVDKVRSFVPDGCEIVNALSKENMGNALGRVPTGVVGLRQGRITKRIVIDLKRCGALSESSD